MCWLSVTSRLPTRSVPTNDQAVRFKKMVEGPPPFFSLLPRQQIGRSSDLISLRSKRSNKSGYCFPSSLSVTNIATPPINKWFGFAVRDMTRHAAEAE